jgi:nitrogen fixation protein NifU and related proteins
MLSDSERSMLLEELARRPHALSDSFTHEAHLVSPTCGDEVTIHLTLSPTFVIQELSWSGHGCTVSMAGAAALSATFAPEVPELRKLYAEYEASVNGGAALDGDLEAFAGIGRFPLRAGCATLAWRAALQAIDVQPVPEV